MFCLSLHRFTMRASKLRANHQGRCWNVDVLWDDFCWSSLFVCLGVAQETPSVELYTRVEWCCKGMKHAGTVLHELTCICICIYTHMCACTIVSFNADAHKCVCIYVCTHMHTHTYVYANMHMQLCIYIYTYADLFTYAPCQVQPASLADERLFGCRCRCRWGCEVPAGDQERGEVAFGEAALSCRRKVYLCLHTYVCMYMNIIRSYVCTNINTYTSISTSLYIYACVYTHV